MSKRESKTKKAKTTPPPVVQVDSVRDENPIAVAEQSIGGTAYDMARAEGHKLSKKKLLAQLAMQRAVQGLESAMTVARGTDSLLWVSKFKTTRYKDSAEVKIKLKFSGHMFRFMSTMQNNIEERWAMDSKYERDAHDFETISAQHVDTAAGYAMTFDVVSLAPKKLFIRVVTCAMAPIQSHIN